MVLLGVRSAWRADLECSPAELTFGTALHLPGEFVETKNVQYDHEFLRQLQKQMGQILPKPTSDHSKVQFRVPNALEGAKFVFIRRDARAPPLTRPYTGPFKVVQAHPKYFELEVNGKADKVLIDRLKKAYVTENQCYDRKNQSPSLPESRD